MKYRIAVAVSGGVDSAVAAQLLSRQGHEVVGITMCLGVAVDEAGRTKCCGPQEIEDARRVCRMYDVPHYTMDFSRDLEEDVIKPFIEEYQQGRTPNPCVACNRFIKFGSLLDKATAMGFDFLATGHYAGMARQGDKPLLIRSKEARKDQTYFLYAIRREVLERIRFPLGALSKNEVRQIARESGLHVSDKQESQDLCFIPQASYGVFLRERSIGVSPGEFVDRKGNVLGRHGGYALYTKGQRARLGGRSGNSLYVLAVDAGTNRVVIGEKADLMARSLVAEEVNLLVDELPERAVAKIRYRHRDASCQVALDGDQLRVVFDEPQEAITPGQHVVLYDGDIVLGGGVIKEAVN